MGSVKKIPMRKCVGCGEMKSKKEMMRVLKTSENEIHSGCDRQEKRSRGIPLLFTGMSGKGSEKQRA